MPKTKRKPGAGFAEPPRCLHCRDPPSSRCETFDPLTHPAAFTLFAGYTVALSAVTTTPITTTSSPRHAPTTQHFDFPDTSSSSFREFLFRPDRRLTTSPRIPASQAFQGRHGRAYLFNDVCNITLGGKEDRLLMTGLHTVRDVFCASCSSLLGWKYDFAYEQSQKYKEGKFIVEKAMVLHEGGW